MVKFIQTLLVLMSLFVAILAAGCQQDSAISGEIHDAVDASNRGDADVADGATAILAGGCFWCVESDFEKLPGVTDVVSGYSGGSTANPTYANYSDGGHVEVVKVTYDPSQVTYAGLVEWLIKHSDPTDGKGSFVDRGAQYRPVVYYDDEQEKQDTEKVIAAVNKSGVYKKPLVLEVAKRENFWPAEDYHQDYARNSLVKYDYYRYNSGRDAFIEKHWGDRVKKLELPGSLPEAMDDSGSTLTRGAPADDSAPSDAVANADSVEQPWQDFRKPSKQELQQELTDIQYEVTQQDGTEPAFQNKYWDNKDAGIYVDLVSGEPLFSSTDQFKSGTGWPSFVRPLDAKFITLKEDNTLFTTRTEVRSKIADSHLGHIFNDGPPDRGGKRWCMNSAAMKFVPIETMEAEGYGKYLSVVAPTKDTNNE